eukprot:scaffold101121_cov63-Phaeocystis_antarctica.AAC.2
MQTLRTDSRSLPHTGSACGCSPPTVPPARSSEGMPGSCPRPSAQSPWPRRLEHPSAGGAVPSPHGGGGRAEIPTAAPTRAGAAHLVPAVIEAGRDPAGHAPAADWMGGLCEPTRSALDLCRAVPMTWLWCARHWNGTAEVEADLARLDERRVGDADPAHGPIARAHCRTGWHFPPNGLRAVGAR